MELIEWKDEFSLGVPSIDHEHRELINLINDMITKVSESESCKENLNYLGEIYAKISMHFALEEKIMRENKYDEYHDHKADHERLLNDIREIMDEYEDNENINVDEFVYRLNHWFTDHFKTKDARLHKHFDIN